MAQFGPHNNHRGSILLYVMFMIAAISIFCVSYSTTITDLQKQVASSKAKLNTNFDVLQTIKLMKLPNGLVESAGLTGNESLYVCLRDGVTGACTENCCQGNTELGFTYADPSDNNTNVNLKRKLMGPPNQPVFYRSNGMPCTPSEANPKECAYSLTSSFIATCPGGDTACAHAEHLKVKIALKMNPLAFEKQVLPKDQNFEFIYFNNLNYRPQIVPIVDQELYLGDGIEKEVTILGESGHPSEMQNFIFTKCTSANTNVVQITTPANQPFSGGSAKIRLKAMNTGTTQVHLQIDDGSPENNISKELSFNVKVLAGTSP